MAGYEALIENKDDDAALRAALDSSSLEAFNDAQRLHVSRKSLSRASGEAARALQASTSQAQHQLRDGLSYEQLLSGQMSLDEQVLLEGQGLDYSGRELQVFGFDKELDKTPGRMFLTTKRIIFLSVTQWQTMEFSKVGDPKKDLSRASYYKLQHSLQDSVKFGSYKMAWVKTLALDATIGGTGSTTLTPKQDSCCGFFACCFSKHWEERSTGVVLTNTRTISLGIDEGLSRPQHIKVKLLPYVSMVNVVRFMGEVQRATDLLGGSISNI